ncbi:MAG: hypothetical protein U9R13_08805, partial [Campylobacterota bacterium]|nr:hypothetical protein [Campylobacterota bacterium]
MAHHPKKTLKQHHLQIVVIIFGMILWFLPVPSGLDTFIGSMPAADLKFTSQTAWHLFAIFITVIFAVILNSMPIFTAAILGVSAVILT